MGKLTTFTHVTIDGFFAGPKGEMDWFKSIRHTDDWESYTHEQSRQGGTLVFGRKTYEIMRSWWPTPQAAQADPEMAKVVNLSPKLVFSKTLKEVSEESNWKNVTLVRDIVPKDVQKRKKEAKGEVTILGSGSIVQQLSNLGLIDEYSLVVVPLVLGAGKNLFENVRKKDLKLVESKSFQNGLTVLRYERS